MVARHEGWRLNNRHRFKVLLAAHIYRARKAGIEGGFRLDDWMAILEHYAPDNRCLACGEMKPLSIDHVIPMTMTGSTNWPGNLQPLCKECNINKNNQMHDYRPDHGAFAHSLTEERMRDPGPWQKVVYLKPIWEKREQELGRTIKTSDMADRFEAITPGLRMSSKKLTALKCGYAEYPSYRIIKALCLLLYCRPEDILFDTTAQGPEAKIPRNQLLLFDSDA